MAVDVPQDAVVLRFKPTTPESVLSRAEREARRSGVHGLSVFADTARTGETEDDVLQRLLRAAELSGISPGSNRTYYVCTSARELLARGFKFVKDGDDDELPEHFTVDIGPEPTLIEAQRFVEAFDQERRR